MIKTIKECTAKEIFNSESKNRSNSNYKKVLTMIFAMHEKMKEVTKIEDWNSMEQAWIEVKKQIKPEILNTKINL